MTTRELVPQERLVPPPLFADVPASTSVEAQEAGDAFLVAADSAIDRALSGNAQAFLQQNRQLGGQ